MLYTLGNIFSAKPRQAEETDTRQALNRHDPDYENRRKKKRIQINQEITEDGATVSVQALKAFLENFIRSSGEESAEIPAPPKNSESAQKPIPTQENKATKPVESNRAAQAASIYEKTAQGHENSVLFETTDQSTGPALDLSAADRRTIYTLIDDLKILNDAHIEYLRIERADTFLESLVNAVKTVKSAL